MSEKTTGEFLLSLRKENGYTQQEVADKLNVSNKTVSKWERDDGYPDIKILPAIADLYSVSVDEILRGERKISEKEAEEKNDEKAFSTALLNFKNKSVIAVAISVLSAFAAYFSTEFADRNDRPIFNVLAVIAGVVAVIIEAVAGNSLLTLKTEENSEGLAERIGKNSFVITLFSFLTLSIVISEFVDLYDIDVLLVFILIGLLIAAFTKLTVKNKIYIDEKSLTPRAKSLKKKAVLATSFLSAVIMVFAAVACIEVSYTNYTETKVDFREITDGTYEYSLLKGFVLNGEPVYALAYENEGELEIGLHVLMFETKEDNGIYFIESCDVSDEIEYKYFSSEEYKYDFIRLNVLRESSCWAREMKTIRFDDENYTVYYKEGTDGEADIGFCDYAPLYLLIGFAVSVGTVFGGYALYKRFKEELFDN